MKYTNGHLTLSKRVLIINNHSIMGAAVERLLSYSEHLQITGSTPLDEIDLVRDVWRFSPDVIILSRQSKLTNPIRLLSLLENYGSFRLVVISENDNTLEIYERQQMQTKQGADLTISVQSV